MNAFTFVWRNLDHFRKRFIIAFISGIASGTAGFFIPYLLADVTKVALAPTQLQGTILLLCGLWLGILTFSWVIRNFGEPVSVEFRLYLKIKYFRRLEALPYFRLNEFHSGYVLSLLNSLGNGAEKLLFNLFWSLAFACANLGLFYYVTIKQSLALALVNFGVFFVFVIVSTVLSQKLAVLNSQTATKIANLTETFADFLTNVKTVKRLGIYDYAESKIVGREQDAAKQVRRAANFHAWRWFILHTIYYAGMILTLSFLLSRISHNGLSASILILYVSILTSIRFNIERLSETLKQSYELKGYIASLEQIFTGVETRKLPAGQTGFGRITFTDIAFTYPGNETTVLVPEFKLSRGDIVGVVGESGQGKSTLLNLLFNGIEPISGSRLVDETSFGDSGDFFRGHMAYVSQEVELFNISLRENLSLGRDVKDEELFALLEELRLAGWARGLGAGLGTVVGEKGVKLSSGQKQRINLLRGVLLDKNILLLDEPTSHLDHKTEQQAVAFLRRHLENKTAVIVTHKPEVLALCNRVYEFRDHTLRVLSRNT